MNEKKQKRYEIAKNYAILKGGECLSNEYVNAHNKMLWQCGNGHPPWEASLDQLISKNTWCRTCAFDKYRNQFGLEQAKQYAQTRDGICLSLEYTNAATNMLWQCKDAHQPWEASFNTVVTGKHWCPSCKSLNASNEKLLKDGLQFAVQYASLRGGKCLSNKYIDSKTKMLWQCGNGHEPWNAKYTNVINDGGWCPKCSKKLISEKRTRLIFEIFFGKPFPTTRPKWNTNPWIINKWTNQYSLLELDGYCKEFNIAFEYDGPHHYSVISYNSAKKTKNDLTYQKFKDHQKKKNCLKQGVLLINIPFLEKRNINKFKCFLDHIIKSCKPYGIEMDFKQDQLQSLEKLFYTIN